jgi:hypothetical protein
MLDPQFGLGRSIRFDSRGSHSEGITRILVTVVMISKFY